MIYKKLEMVIFDTPTQNIMWHIRLFGKFLRTKQNEYYRNN